MLKIGVLCPYSSIYPNLHIDFLDGLRLAIPKDYLRKVEFCQEYIGQGSSGSVRNAIEKLVHFQRVDVLTGFCNYKVIDVLLSVISNRNVVAFMADMGEIVPKDQIISNQIFFNSLGLWQSEYALGQWANEQFKQRGNGVVCMSLYEAGYHISSAFTKGYFAGGGQTLETSIIPQQRASQAVMNQYFQEYILKFKKEQPAFIHALFAGQEAIDFIGMYSEMGLMGEIPLLVSSHMASQEILERIQGAKLDMYSASNWDISRDNEENKKFVKLYLKAYGRMPNAFDLLGYETGMALTSSFSSLMKKDFSEVNKLLGASTLRTPRGEHLFNWNRHQSPQPVFIEKVTAENGMIKKILVDQKQKVSYYNAAIRELSAKNVSGFLNPYLCI